MEKRFNVRVYGILTDNGKVLVNEEWIKDRVVIKFPGGGLDWGEGTIDCLKREWKEELGLDIEVRRHFYTTDFFQQSAFDDSQVISIYYLVSVHIEREIVNYVPGERTFWMNIADIHNDTFTLPIDQKVAALLLQEYRHLID
ncbi:MAG: NUDIX domain-containing protein [Chitinophagia bacterium]|nr:NUDIX domain-containing protein [Chitinophagia bacterium]